MTTNLILGTAGHIDHGKTSLVLALTGVHTDRLPEEKKRGITIELGYASLSLGDFQLGIVDVPGHEKFVRQMLAGATGMDLAMLIVAADDSAKPQTHEHLDILRMLNLPAGVIAITKCDLVDADWLDLVEEEVRQLVSDTFLADAPIVRTSAESGMGLDELKTALTEAAKIASTSDRQQRMHAPFRMAIDRSFTMTGHGAVVTGSVNSGTAALGDAVRVEPGGFDVKIRGLQVHDSSAEKISRGQRAAVNLSGIDHHSLQRGQEICSQGHLRPSKLMTVDLSVVESAVRPLKDRTRIRFHIGTAEVIGVIRLLETVKLEPGERGYAQVFFAEPAVAVYDQPFVIRAESPVVTIGGGRVLNPVATKMKQLSDHDRELLSDLRDGNQYKRAAASLYFADPDSWSPKDLPRLAGVMDFGPVVSKLVEDGVIVEVQVSQSVKKWIHRSFVDLIGNRVNKMLNGLHDKFPLQIAFDAQSIGQQFDYLPFSQLFQMALMQLKDERVITFDKGKIALVGRGPKLSKNEKKLLEQLVDEFKVAEMQPPEIKDLQKSASKNRDSIPQLLEMAVASGDLIKVNQQFLFHRTTMNHIKETIADAINGENGLTLSEIRELLSTTRKYAVPLAEYLDSIGFTRRDGDQRFLA